MFRITQQFYLTALSVNPSYTSQEHQENNKKPPMKVPALQSYRSGDGKNVHGSTKGKQKGFNAWLKNRSNPSDDVSPNLHVSEKLY